MIFAKTIRSLVVFTPTAHGFHYGPLCEHLRLLCHELNIQLHTICTQQLDHASHLLALADADGVIIIQNALPPALVNQLQALQLPVITLGYQDPQNQIDAVLHNNSDGIIQAFTHLYEQGHREIVFVSAQGDQNMQERQQAFQECLQAYDLSRPSQACIQVCSHSFPGGHEAAEKIIQMDPMPTAVICGNDLQAVGLDRRLREHGWYAPEHIAVIGFEGLTMGQQHRPQISSVKIDPFAMAEAAIERLLALANDSQLPQQTFRVDCRLHPSQSCGSRVIPHSQPERLNPSLTNAYLSTHENLSSDLSELLSLNSELGQFMQWACIARWQPGSTSSLKLIEMQGNFTPQSIEELAGLSQCSAHDFPHKEWLKPYVASSAHLLTLPLSINGEPWGLLCLAGEIKNSKQLALYQQFADMTSTLAERIERSVLEERLKQQSQHKEFLQKRLHHAHKQTDEGLWEWDLQKDQVHWNDKALELFGFTPEQWDQVSRSESFVDRIHLLDRTKVQRRLKSYVQHGIPFSVTFRMARQDGELNWYVASGEAVSVVDGEPKQLIGSIQDITEKRRSLHQFQMKINSDPLTGLPNRTLVSEQLTLQLQKSPEQTLAVFQLGLDRFKHLNTRFSHEQGDKLLQLVGKNLRDALRENDFFARFNGDEFICLCPVDNQRQAVGMANRLRRLLEQPLQQELGIDFYVTASIGVTLYPAHANTPTDLLRRADIAMRQAKDNGKNQVALYKPCIQADLNSRARIDNELRKAIKNNELSLVYQPQHCPISNELQGVEALLRWRSAELGDISPGEFIPLAEENGQIVDLGYWVMKEACTTLKQWQLVYGSSITMSLNVSAGQLSHPAFLKNAHQLILATGISPEKLILEITESTAIADIDNVRSSLEKLTAQGIQIALDDFGTGYSSISLLRQLPLASLKIDRSFFRGLQKDSQDWHIIKAIQVLASALGHKVVAEGVETPEQLDLARELKCDQVQGFIYSRPLAQTTLESTYFHALSKNVHQLA